MFWLCDFGVGADIGAVPSFINIEHVFISERKLLTSMCCYLVQNTNHHKKNQSKSSSHTCTNNNKIECTHTFTNKKKGEKHNTQVTIIRYAATISKHRPLLDLLLHMINVVTATRLMLSSLRPKSPQRISSFKLLCRHHSNHSLGSTLDLRS